jgi:hypothetical protein
MCTTCPFAVSGTKVPGTYNESFCELNDRVSKNRRNVNDQRYLSPIGLMAIICELVSALYSKGGPNFLEFRVT